MTFYCVKIRNSKLYYSENCYVKNLLADKSTFSVGVAYLTHVGHLDDEQVQAVLGFHLVDKVLRAPINSQNPNTVIMVATETSSSFSEETSLHQLNFI